MKVWIPVTVTTTDHGDRGGSIHVMTLDLITATGTDSITVIIRIQIP